MADTIEQQLQAAQAQLEVLEGELGGAKRALAQWEDYDMRREDGSGAQDRRHEESGQYRREAVDDAAEAVRAQRRVITELTEKLAQA